nr:MAG TPA: hypothetical protein [Caudoviricetes sp.]
MWVLVRYNEEALINKTSENVNRLPPIKAKTTRFGRRFSFFRKGQKS